MKLHNLLSLERSPLSLSSAAITSYNLYIFYKKIKEIED